MARLARMVFVGKHIQLTSVPQDTLPPNGRHLMYSPSRTHAEARDGRKQGRDAARGQIWKTKMTSAAAGRPRVAPAENNGRPLRHRPSLSLVPVLKRSAAYV